MFRQRDELYRCPKCDSLDWRFKHVEAGSFDNYGDPSLGYNHHWDEHLEVSCGICGYTFDMETADAKVPA